MKSSLKSSIAASTVAATHTSLKKTSFKPTTTTWQRQAASNQTTPVSPRSVDDPQLTNEYLSVKMQLEMKKRAIERDKQRLENLRDSKRQTISQEAFKQLLQQKTRKTSKLTNEFLSSSPSVELNNHHSSPSIPKSQTTAEFRFPRSKSSTPEPTLTEAKREESSIVDLSKPMTRDEFLNTLELLKKKYIETTTTATPTPTIDDQRADEGRRIEQLNSNIGELQQVNSVFVDERDPKEVQIVTHTCSLLSLADRRVIDSLVALEYLLRPSRLMEILPSLLIVHWWIHLSSVHFIIEGERRRTRGSSLHPTQGFQSSELRIEQIKTKDENRRQRPSPLIYHLINRRLKIGHPFG